METNNDHPRINYVSQMNAFRELKVNTPGMTAGIISVYYALLDMNNQSKWAIEFDVDFGYMLALARVDKTTYYKALDFLKKIGCISTYTKGVNNYTRAKVSLSLLYDKSLGNSLGKQVGESLGNSLGNTESEQNNIETVNSKRKKEILINEFDEFWNLYDKKTGREKVLKKWSSLNAADHKAIIAAIPKYNKSTPDRKFRKDPLTYLNGRHWEDEIIIDRKEDSSVTTAFVFGKKPQGHVRHEA
jgi:hypothetical protein